MAHRLLSLNHIASEQFEGKPHSVHFRASIAIPIGLVGKPKGGFCIICIMRSMEADCLEYQRVMHIGVSMENRYCTPGFPGDPGTPFHRTFLIIKRLQRIPGNQGCRMPYRFREGAGASSCGFRCKTGAYRTDSVAGGGVWPSETYRFRCGKG